MTSGYIQTLNLSLRDSIDFVFFSFFYHLLYIFLLNNFQIYVLYSFYNENGRQSNPNVFPSLRAELLLDQCPLRGLPKCQPASKRYRTADGTCNNLNEPWYGASMLPMQRFLQPNYDDRKYFSFFFKFQILGESI